METLGAWTSPEGHYRDLRMFVQAYVYTSHLPSDIVIVCNLLQDVYTVNDSETSEKKI